MEQVQSLPTPEREGIMDIMTSWERKGVERGRHEEARSFTLRLLRLRVGALPLNIEERVSQLSIEKLELLSEATFEISTIDQVESWLVAHA